MNKDSLTESTLRMFIDMSKTATEMKQTKHKLSLMRNSKELKWSDLFIFILKY